MSATRTAESPAWTIPELSALPREAAIALFRTLPAPSLQEMDGEFAGHIPEYHREIWHRTHDALARGRWLGKAYRGQAHGRWPAQGYNRIRMAEGVRRHSRFGWEIAPSGLDGRPALIMTYAAFDNWCGQQDLIDEVRRAGDGVYLGIYHTRTSIPGFTSDPGGERSALQVFMLSGPTGPWVGPDYD